MTVTHKLQIYRVTTCHLHLWKQTALDHTCLCLPANCENHDYKKSEKKSKTEVELSNQRSGGNLRGRYYGFIPIFQCNSCRFDASLAAGSR